MFINFFINFIEFILNIFIFNLNKNYFNIYIILILLNWVYKNNIIKKGCILFSKILNLIIMFINKNSYKFIFYYYIK